MPDHATANRLRVLIVEDDGLIAAAFASVFEDAGHDVVGPAMTSEEALALIEGGERIDAAFIDVALRHGTSGAVADALRRRNIEFVFCSGHLAVDVSAEIGGAKFLAKPLGEAELLAALDEMRRISVRPSACAEALPSGSEG